MPAFPPDPPLHNSIQLPAELTEESISFWLEELPLANVAHSGQALLTLLRALNQVRDFSPDERLAQLERLRPTAYMLAERAAEMHLGGDVAFPLAHAVRHSLALGALLCRELAQAYSTVAIARHFFAARLLDKGTQQLGIFRALEAYAQNQLRCLIIYTPMGRDFWKSVYGLYMLAEQRGWHTETLAGVEGGGSILRVFKHILLFSLANCLRHRPLEIQQIHAVTGKFAHLAVVHDKPTHHDQKASFVFALDADSPPHPIRGHAERLEQEVRYLFTRDLVEQALAYYADSANRYFGGMRLRRTMLKRLLHALGTPARRKSQRIPLKAERTLTVGLDDLAATLAGEKVSSQTPKPPKTAGSIQVKGITLLNVPDYTVQAIDTPAYASEARETRSEIAAAQRWRGEPASLRSDDIWQERGLRLSPSRSPSIPLVWTINASAHGYCLCWINKEQGCVRVDELIGIPAESGEVNIGVIRWLSHDAAENLLLGVELLAPSATPVTLSLMGSFEEERRGLLLPVNERLGQPSRLLTPPSYFQLGQILRLEVAGYARNCRLVELVEANFSFNHFIVVEVDDE